MFVKKRKELGFFYTQIMKDGSTSTDLMKENIHKFNLLGTLLQSQHSLQIVFGNYKAWFVTHNHHLDKTNTLLFM